MTSGRSLLLILVLALAAGCGGGGGGGRSTGVGVTGPSVTGNNVLSITVNGSLCSPATSASYINKPCVSVTVCSPGGTSTCQTINDILLDTGSYGLRIFKSVLSPALSFPSVASGSGALAECVQFADGTAVWGPVQVAGVTLASEPTVTVPLQVIDAGFANINTALTSTICPGAEQNPAAAGFNGILGVGVFIEDCGPACVNTAGNGMYFSCSGSACGGATASLSQQVRNPVALLPQDNNGVIVMLPGVPAGGALWATGSLVLGIGTQANNMPFGVTAYPTDQFGEFTTVISGSAAAFSGFLDSGSNGLFFTAPSARQLPDCGVFNAGWFCPPSLVNLSATNTGASGSPSGVVPFQIGNFNILVSSPNYVFDDVGGSAPGIFDWGLPFHFGRNVYVGIEGKGSSLGIGPYVAY